MGNYSFKTTGLPEPVTGVIERCNFTQAVPHTPIYSGYSNITFKKCNLTNCDLPEGSVVVDCLYPVHISFCSHVRPELLNMGVISPCQSDCLHKVSTDTITIDGIVVDIVNYYENKEV
jgi:hypothetical protein